MAKDQQASAPVPEPLPLQRSQHLHLVTDTPKGRGIFAAQAISSGTIIDISPVLILSHEENKSHIEHTSLYHYTYNWPCRNGSGMTQAVVFGLGSMFNHSREAQNVGWKRDLQREVVVYWVLRDVEAGEELCISYGDKLTFTDADGEKEVESDEKAEDVLGRIEVDAV